MTTGAAAATNATDLASFRAVQATASSLEIASAPDESKVIRVINVSDGEFTLGFRAGAPGVVVPLILRILDDDELGALLDALQDELDSPPDQPGLNLAVLRAFVTVLSEHLGPSATNRFEHARFGAVARDMRGAIVGHLGLGTDVVGTVHDSGGAISFEQHVVVLPPGRFRPLSQPDLDSLAAALTVFTETTPDADPLWRQVLDDLRR